MKTKQRLIGFLCAVAISGAMLLAPSVKAATPVQSPVKLNNAYAEGTCGFTATYATATTRHPVSSSKCVRAYAYGYANGVIGQLNMSSLVQGTGTNPVTADTYTTNITGAKGYHSVTAGTLTWSDFSSIGLLYN